MTAFLAFALLLWPWIWFGHHRQSGVCEVGSDGRAVVNFTKHFTRHPTCSAISRSTHRTLTPRAWSKDGMDFLGTPGDVLDWTCKHNSKGPK